MSARGDSWTKAEERKLLKGLNKGLKWPAIADSLPGRSRSACQAHALSMSDAGQEVKHRDRAPLRGRGGGAGRPRNEEPSTKLFFRLSRGTRDAFKQLAGLEKRKLGELLRTALERLAAGKKRKLSTKGSEHAVQRNAKHAGARVAVCWGVPTHVLQAAIEAHEKGSCETAEAAVLGLLKAHGYRGCE